MAWYDNGLQGTFTYPLSSNITQPALYYGNPTYNAGHPVIIDSYSLNTNKGDGETYRALLNTFSMGTQIYLDFTVEARTVTYPASNTLIGGTCREMRHGFYMYMKNADGTIINLGGGGDSILVSRNGGEVPYGLGYSIYGWEYGTTNGQMYATACFPFGGRSAVNTQSLICAKSSAGIDFYVAGFQGQLGPFAGDVYVTFSCPLIYIGRIPNSYLNDPKWFDPDADAFKGDSDSNGGFGMGGNIPDLPVSPSYPGTDMTFPSVPTGASAFGFSRLNLFKPSAEQLADALDILYYDSDESTLETILESCKKWFYKPEQYCISLMLSAVDATATIIKPIKFGKYDPEVNASCVDNQWQITDCGTIDIPLKYGSFLDFEPHAKIKLYLPYVGLRSLNANEVIGGQLAIKYYTDMLTGVSVCMVLVSRPGSNNTILYTFDCNIGIQVPLTSENYNKVVSNLLSAGVSAGIAIAGTAMGGVGGVASLGASAGTIGAGVGALSSMGSPELTQSGNLSANSGVLCYPKPYVCIQMPIPTTPSNYNYEKGRPSNVYTNIGSCQGFTVISNLHVDIPGALDSEVQQIRDKFKKGVFI